MTLGNLTRNTTVQGDIMLQLWNRDGVVAQKIIKGTEDLDTEPSLGLWKRSNIKYIFASPDGMLHIDFDMEECRKNVLMRNPKATIIPICAKTGEGVDKFAEWLSERIKEQKN